MAIRVALLQLAVGVQKTENVTRATRLIADAMPDHNPQLIVLPECFNSPYGVDYFPEYAESIPGPTSKALSDASRKHKVTLVGGSFPERRGDKLYNTSLVYGPDGELMATFRKLHLFDIDVPGKITFKESSVLTAGSELATFTVGGVKVGLGICYDIRFPELAARYAADGCHLLMYPGAFNMTTGPAHWELLTRARALDNQLYVACCSAARDTSATYVTYGHSLIAGPWGDVLAAAKDEEAIIYTDVDPARVEEVRSSIPTRHQHRPELFK